MYHPPGAMLYTKNKQSIIYLCMLCNRHDESKTKKNSCNIPGHRQKTNTTIIGKTKTSTKGSIVTKLSNEEALIGVLQRELQPLLHDRLSAVCRHHKLIETSMCFGQGIVIPLWSQC
jgi:hypothetical protein